jgi:eukaryotic-like serine/threonine-protein kinase
MTDYVARKGRDEIATVDVRGASGTAQSHEATEPLDEVVRSSAELPTPSSSVFANRYRVIGMLGQGGMGTVLQCEDQLIGRSVALKVLSSSDADGPQQRRFLREGRVQGQLEHPAIVPVYDLGLDAKGELFFTMKRVRGVSLRQVLRGLRAGDPGTAASYSRRRLLAAFSSICLAVDFAHRRGVLHRDLKPANLMFGDFGEVYVLDWGVAKVLSGPELPASDLADPRVSEGEADDDGERTQTLAGTILGTPGYASPEQARGDAQALSARTDVYALGAILFELLTLDRLHQGDTAVELLVSAVDGVEAHISLRRPELDVAPELEAICVQATARDPADRFPSARAVHEAVEHYLDGDRDTELRRQLAAEHARRAEGETRTALRTGREADRASALRAVGRALALDPENAAAVSSLVSLLTQPPKEVPAAARDELQRSAVESARHAYRFGAVAYLSWYAMVPIMLAMGVRDWPLATAVWLTMGSAGIVALLAGRAGRAGSSSARYGLAALLLSCVGMALGSRMFGPFIFVPGAVVMNALVYTIQPFRRLRVATLVLSSLALAVPVALEQMSLVPQTFLFEHGALSFLPTIIEFPRTLSVGVLTFVGVGMLLTSSLFVGRVRDKLADAERALQLQAWQLRQLVATQRPEEDGTNGGASAARDRGQAA